MNKLLNSKVGVVGAVALVGLGLAYLAERKARKVASDVGQAINPVNDNNIFYTGVNAVGAKLTSNENFNLGAWIYDAVNGSPTEQLINKNSVDNP